MTPEGRVKNAVKKILKSYDPEVYYHMPVQNGMGSPSLDFICCGWGKYFAIETKAPGKKPTPRQEVTIEEIKKAGGIVFVIDDPVNGAINDLIGWLDYMLVTGRLQEV